MTATPVLDRVQSFLSQVARSSDVALVVLLMVAMAVMILPLPTMLIDTLIAWNIGASVLILIVAVYLPHPLAFSTLPAVILTATLFRLATEVAVTRLILVQVDAGEIVRAFGDFVVSGNVIVGLVTFLIITIVQFVVITKGSERVAEVAARFTLDAMPGKQMSIDSDLRSGDIDQREARRRRHQLEQESQLYGAMDGAMKFVKGDAIAGLVIVLVNLLGGIAIGCLQHGMSWSEATHTYSLLTIGDGLVSQIPALVISFAAGTIVTRVSDDSAPRNLGTEITRQVAGNPRSLSIAAVALTLLGFVPGFPTLVFLALAAAAGGRAFWLWRQERASVAIADDAASDGMTDGGDATPEPVERAPEDAVLVLSLAPGLADTLGRKGIEQSLRRTSQALGKELGIDLPLLWTRLDESLSPARFQFDVESVPAASGSLKPGALLLCEEPARLAELQVVATPGEPLPGRSEVHWVDAEQRPALDAAGIAWMDWVAVLASIVETTLRRLAPHFIGVQEARQFLSGAEGHYKDLVQEVQRTVPLQSLAEVCRTLLEEGVPLRPARLILGALAEAAPKEQHPALLADYVRVALKRQICHRYADRGRLHVLIVEHGAEEALRAAAQQGAAGAAFVHADAQLQTLIAAIRRHLGGRDADSPRPVVLTAYEIRRFVRTLLLRNDIDVPVLSYQELSPDISVQAIGSVTGGERSEAAPSLHLVKADGAHAPRSSASP